MLGLNTDSLSRRKTETTWFIESPHSAWSLFFKRCYLFTFREKGREGERKGEKHQCVVASLAPLNEDLACNTEMCPDWELNQRPFGSQAGTQSTEPHQPGLSMDFRAQYRINKSIRFVSYRRNNIVYFVNCIYIAWVTKFCAYMNLMNFTFRWVLKFSRSILSVWANMGINS